MNHGFMMGMVKNPNAASNVDTSIKLVVINGLIAPIH